MLRKTHNQFISKVVEQLKSEGCSIIDEEAAERRMERIQTKIDAAEMLGLGTIEYEKRATRPVHLEKALMIGNEDDKTQVAIHTIQQSKSKEGNLRVCLCLDVWEKKEDVQHE